MNSEDFKDTNMVSKAWKEFKSQERMSKMWDSIKSYCQDFTGQ